MSLMYQNPPVEPVPGEEEVFSSDKLIKSVGASAFNFDGSPSASIVKEVHTWFMYLIKDTDVIDSTGTDINVLADIVTSTGTAVSPTNTMSGLIEIGVLRYPDIENLFYKLYRIKFTAWSNCSRVLFLESDKNGITGEFRSRKFKARQSVIAGVREEIRKKAVDEAEDLLSFLW
ncbi:unnamed protein product [Discosporangium mesarthrocarpum]